MAERWTLDRIRTFLKSQGCTLISDKYEGYNTHLRYIATCGHEHTNSLSNLLRGKGLLCKDCRYQSLGSKRARSAESVRQFFASEGCQLLSNSPVNSYTVLTYVARCGHENKIDFNHFYQGGGRICSECSRSVRYKYDYVVEAFEREDCVLLETEYVNCKTPMKYIAQCGHESTISFDVFLNAPSATKRCRACHRHTYHETPSDRNLTAMKNWRKQVYEKDNYNCVSCGKHGGDLNAHHLEAYDVNAGLRFSVENGITLCSPCHTKFHQRYGFGGNTKAQFVEWLQGNTEVSAGGNTPATP